MTIRVHFGRPSFLPLSSDPNTNLFAIGRRSLYNSPAMYFPNSSRRTPLACVPARLDRRTFIKSSAAAFAVASLPGRMSALASQALITGIFLDLNRVHKWDDANGDTWDPFLADDDNLYAFNCDGRGFGPNAMNLAFNKLSGETSDALVGSQVNPMSEYGKSGQKGSDNATWKACGQECIDGVFYAFVSRNT